MPWGVCCLLAFGGPVSTESGWGPRVGVAQTGESPGSNPAGTVVAEPSGAVELAIEGPYPVVLAHGLFGFDDFAGIDFIQYFYGVVGELADAEEIFVFTPAVDPFNDSEHRGDELLEQVEAVAALTGAAKVNIVGHSQGGLDARVVASLRPDLVASVTTIGTPHRGTKVADIGLGLVGNPLGAAIVDTLVQLAGGVVFDTIDGDTSLVAALEQLSTPGMHAFNEAYPDDPDVAYYSIAGRSDWHFGGSTCFVPGAPAFVAEFVFNLDLLDPLLWATNIILDGNPFFPTANDGLVTVKSARWGEFLGCIPADHLDQVGQLLGDGPGFGNDWDHRDFYVDLIAFLRSEGL